MIFGWTLVHFLWQGAALAAALALVMMVTQSAPVRYAFGCLMLGLMGLAPVLTYLFLNQPGTVKELEPLALVLGAGDGLSRAMLLAEPIRWVAWLPLFWGLGVAALSARLLLAAFSVHRLTHHEAKPVTDKWPHLRARMGLTRAVDFLTSPRVTGPAQAGFWKPVVLLPASVLTQLPPAQLEAIIAHELAHIARHDYLVNLLQTAVETLLFYHPSVWWVSRIVRAERELCCDQMAAAVTGNAGQYAAALLAVEELAGGQMAIANAATGGDLRQRIARLLGHDDRPVKVSLPALLVALILAGVMLLPTFASQVPVTKAPSAQETESFSQMLNRWHMDFVRSMGWVHGPKKAKKTLMATSQATPATSYERWLHEDVVYLVKADEAKRFAELKSDAEREKFIEQFWSRRGGETVKTEHYRRITKANSKFGNGKDAGWKTPRGRLYIMKGPPDELEMHPERKQEQWLYRSPREVYEFKL